MELRDIYKCVPLLDFSGEVFYLNLSTNLSLYTAGEILAQTLEQTGTASPRSLDVLIALGRKFVLGRGRNPVCFVGRGVK